MIIICDFSKRVSIRLTEQLVEGHDSSVLDSKQNVESVLKDDTSKRLRRTAAVQPGYGGFSFFADNVGKVIIFCVIESIHMF